MPHQAPALTLASLGFALALLAVLCVPAFAQDEIVNSDQRYVVDVELQNVEDLQRLLERADQLLLDGEVDAADDATVTFILHGPVVRSLLRQNYLANKRTVDLAASLSALGVVDIKACRTWAGGNGVDESQLQPFVETVSYGPDEVQRLIRQSHYSYF